jgi:hypothetical protein
MCAPFRRLVPCSYREGVEEGLGVVAAKSVPSLLVGAGLRLAAAKAACLPACLIRLISAFVGRMMRLSLTLGLAGQLSWLAVWGPQQLAHLALCWQFSSVGLLCPSILEPQCLYSEARVYLTGLHQPWQPLIAWRLIQGFLLMSLA